MKKLLGRAIRRPNSGRFDPKDAHAEQDQAVFVGDGQIEIGLIPEMFGDISQQLTLALIGALAKQLNAQISEPVTPKGLTVDVTRSTFESLLPVAA